MAVLRVEGHAGKPRKAKIIEMQYRYDLNLKSLISMQDIWCCLMEHSAGVRAGCSIKRGSNTEFGKMNQKSDFPQGCRW